MKHYLIIIGLAITCLYVACSKSSTPSPENNSGTTGTNTGSAGNIGGSTTVTTGNTTSYNGYIVKTVGIDQIKIATDINDKLTKAEFVGGGNDIILDVGSGNSVTFNNTYKYEPAIDPAAIKADAFGDANYYAITDKIDNGVQLDTSYAITIKVKGFDKAIYGYNQLNLVLCKANNISQNGVTPFNLFYMYQEKTTRTYNNNYYTNILTTNMKVSSVELAKPLSEKPYIVRNLVISTFQINYPVGGNTINLTFFDHYGLAMLKLNALVKNTYSDLQAGTTLATELVNADKGQFSYITGKNFSGETMYYPTLSNMLSPSVTTLAQPSDSTNNAFIRVSGFDQAKCGFNQIRFFLMPDPYNKDLAPFSLVAQAAQDKPTLSYLKTMSKTSGFACIQLIPY